MKKMITLTKRYWLTASVAVVLAVLFYRADKAVIIHTFVNVSWFYVVAAVLANFVSIMLKVASWKVIFDSGFKGIRARWSNLTSALMIGFLVNLIVPARMGELARAYVIKRRQGQEGEPVSSSTVVGTIVLERVFDGIVFAMIVIYGVTRMNLPAWADRGAIVLLVVSIFVAALLIVLESNRERIRRGAGAASSDGRSRGWWSRQALRFRLIVARFSEGQRVLRSPGRVALIMTTTTASWLTQLFAVYLALHAFHIGLVGMLGALLLLILMNIAGAMPATPGNVGIFQLATVIPLAITYNITESEALAFSIGLQMVEGSIGAGIGSLFLLREGLSLSQVRSESVRELREQELEESLEEELAADIARGVPQPARDDLLV